MVYEKVDVGSTCRGFPKRETRNPLRRAKLPPSAPRASFVVGIRFDEDGRAAAL